MLVMCLNSLLTSYVLKLVPHKSLHYWLKFEYGDQWPDVFYINANNHYQVARKLSLIERMRYVYDDRWDLNNIRLIKESQCFLKLGGLKYLS